MSEVHWIPSSPRRPASVMIASTPALVIATTTVPSRHVAVESSARPVLAPAQRDDECGSFPPSRDDVRYRGGETVVDIHYVSDQRGALVHVV